MWSSIKEQQKQAAAPQPYFVFGQQQDNEPAAQETEPADDDDAYEAYLRSLQASSSTTTQSPSLSHTYYRSNSVEDAIEKDVEEEDFATTLDRSTSMEEAVEEVPDHGASSSSFMPGHDDDKKGTAVSYHRSNTAEDAIEEDIDAEASPMPKPFAQATPHPLSPPRPSGAAKNHPSPFVTPANSRLQWMTTTMTTPSPSHLHFYSQQHDVSSELKRAQEQTLKRRKDFYQRLHGIQLQLAALESRLAQERLDLYRSLAPILQKHVQSPLQNFMSLWGMDKDTNPIREQVLWTLPTRLGRLEEACTQQTHVEASLAIRHHLDSQGVEFLEWKRKSHHHDLVQKVEGHWNRQWEYNVALSTRRYLEESVQRTARLQVLTQALPVSQQEEECQLQLAKIRQLRQILAQERQRRQAADHMVRKQVEETTQKLRRALLVAAEGSS